MEVLQGVGASITFPALGEDPPEFPELKEEEAPVVRITRDSDGSEVKEPPEVEVVEGEGEEAKPVHYVLPLDSTLTGELDILTVTWAEAEEEGVLTGNTYQTQVEIVGGYVTSLAAITEKLGEEAGSEAVAAARETATKEIEGACGVAFRHRYGKDQLDGKGTNRLLLRRRELVRLIAVTVEGTSYSPAQLSELLLDPVGVVQTETSTWPLGRSNIEVAYVHGFHRLAAAVNPVRDYAAYLLAEHPADWQGRATSFTNEFGATYALVTPGVRGARFPLPSVNAFVNQYSEPLVA